ncbi:MAG TPA: hypothetical protein PK668_16410 [Myxococcota bacterium]|nr:hypothetical protein [Myxococcota bacterium]HRY94476.1 hypothetical protein [Myxococcota bacterium]
MSAEGPAPIQDFVQGNRALLSGAEPRLKPGDWVTYLFRTNTPTMAGLARIESLVKISCPLHVGDQPLAAGQFWMEFEMADPAGVSGNVMVLKMLVEGDPRQAGAVKRMFIKAGERTPLEIPEERLKKSADPGTPCDRGDAEGCRAKGGDHQTRQTKRIYTKVGWLEAQSVVIRLPGQKGTREFWVSRKVPVLGFVRATMENGVSLELEGFGDGALSRIDETQAVPLPDTKVLERQLQGAAQ